MAKEFGSPKTPPWIEKLRLNCRWWYNSHFACRCVKYLTFCVSHGIPYSLDEKSNLYGANRILENRCLGFDVACVVAVYLSTQQYRFERATSYRSSLKQSRIAYGNWDGVAISRWDPRTLRSSTSRSEWFVLSNINGRPQYAPLCRVSWASHQHRGGHEWHVHACREPYSVRLSWRWRRTALFTFPVSLWLS